MEEEINSPDNWKEIIAIGLDKNGEPDFRISGELYNLDLKRMNKFRAMIVAAIGSAEDSWRKSNQQYAPIDWKNLPSEGGPFG